MNIKNKQLCRYLTFDKKELGNLEYSFAARNAGYGSQRRLYEHDHRLLQHAQVPWSDGGPSTTATALTCCSRRWMKPSCTTANPSIWRCTVFREPTNLGGISTSPISNIRRHRRSPTAWEASCCARAALDTQPYAVDDPLYAARGAVRRTSPTPAFLRLPGQTCPHACQYGGRRTLPADSGGVKCRLYPDSPGCICKPIAGMRSSFPRPTGTIISNTPEIERGYEGA